MRQSVKQAISLNAYWFIMQQIQHVLCFELISITISLNYNYFKVLILFSITFYFVKLLLRLNVEGRGQLLLSRQHALL